MVEAALHFSTFETPLFSLKYGQHYVTLSSMPEMSKSVHPARTLRPGDDCLPILWRPHYH